MNQALTLREFLNLFKEEKGSYDGLSSVLDQARNRGDSCVMHLSMLTLREVNPGHM